MAAKRSRSHRVPYDILNNISSVEVIYDEIKKKRPRTIGTFQAERLLAKSDKEGNKYLVKWKGYSSFENTWEPESHLSAASIRYFEEPNPPQDIVQQHVDSLRRAVMEALRHKGPEQRVGLDFRHDVYHHLFHGKGKPAEQKQWTLFEEKDFSLCKLPEYWNYIVDHHGDGRKVRFPVKMRTFLGRSPKNHKKVGDQIVEMPQLYTEKLSLIFIKVSSIY